MGVELILVLGEVVALVAGFLVVDFEDVRRQSLGAGGLVVAQHTDERFRVGVEVTLESPIVGAGPRAVATGEPFLAFDLLHERFVVFVGCFRGTGCDADVVLLVSIVD